MTRYAHIEDGHVVNVIIWDGESSFTVPSGELVMLSDISEVGIGWTLEGDEWIAPEPPEDEWV